MEQNSPDLVCTNLHVWPERPAECRAPAGGILASDSSGKARAPWEPLREGFLSDPARDSPRHPSPDTGFSCVTPWKGGWGQGADLGPSPPPDSNSVLSWGSCLCPELQGKGREAERGP